MKLRLHGVKAKYNIAVGVDLESIVRFRTLNRGKNKIFLNRIFTKREIEYCYSKTQPAQHLAVRFAGKEAVIKALSSMALKPPPRNSIEIANDKKGAPNLSIKKNKMAEEYTFRISLSHCDDKALAFVIIVAKNYE